MNRKMEKKPFLPRGKRLTSPGGGRTWISPSPSLYGRGNGERDMIFVEGTSLQERDVV